MSSRICLGVDNGHYAHKVYDHVGAMSSVLTRCKLGEDLSVAMMSDVKSTNLTVVTEGVPYTCGKLRRYEEVNPLTFPESNAARVLLHYAIAMHKEGKYVESENLSICTGIPIGRYYKQGRTEVDHDLVNSIIKNLSQPVTIKYPNGKEVTKSVNVIVKPQTFVAWYAYILEEIRTSGMADPSKPQVIKHEDRFSEPVAFIDIGGGTTDIVVIEDTRMDIAASGSEFIGSNDIRRDFERLVCERFSMDGISSHLLDKAMQTMSLALDGKQYDVSELYKAAHSEANAKLLSFIKNKLGTNRQRQLNSVRLIGGGCHQFSEPIRQAIHRSEQVEHPQFENAKGMYLLARYLSK